MLALAVAGSPLADALLSLIATLGTAASAANAAVAATTPAEVSAAASELVCNAENVLRLFAKVFLRYRTWKMLRTMQKMLRRKLRTMTVMIHLPPNLQRVIHRQAQLHKPVQLP